MTASDERLAPGVKVPSDQVGGVSAGTKLKPLEWGGNVVLTSLFHSFHMFSSDL